MLQTTGSTDIKTSMRLFVYYNNLFCSRSFNKNMETVNKKDGQWLYLYEMFKKRIAGGK